MFPEEKEVMIISEFGVDNANLSSHTDSHTIECWGCRKDFQGVTGQDAMKMVEDVGWIAAVDFQRRRVLVFCSERCRDRAKAHRTGMFRWRRPR